MIAAARAPLEPKGAALAAALLTGLASGTAWAWWRRSGRAAMDAGPLALLAAGTVAMAVVALGAPGIWQAASGGYAQDSLATLSPSGIAGVVAISAVAIAALVVANGLAARILLALVPPDRAARIAALIANLVATLGAFGVLFSLSPQLYYALYRTLFPSLPAQWVIRSWFDQARLVDVARLAPDGNLADHLAGVTLWSLVLLTIWIHLARSGFASHRRAPLAVGAVTALVAWILAT